MACSRQGDCIETIGNYTCSCHPGFYGPDCEYGEAAAPWIPWRWGCAISTTGPLLHSGAPRLTLGAKTTLFLERTCARPSQEVKGGCKGSRARRTLYQGKNGCFPGAAHAEEQRGPSGGRSLEGHRVRRVIQIVAAPSKADLAFKPTLKRPLSRPTVRECGTPELPQRVLMDCSHPLGDFSFRSRCSFRCAEGYTLDGARELECLASGTWSNKPPHCVGM